MIGHTDRLNSTFLNKGIYQSPSVCFHRQQSPDVFEKLYNPASALHIPRIPCIEMISRLPFDVAGD